MCKRSFKDKTTSKRDRLYLQPYMRWDLRTGVSTSVMCDVLGTFYVGSCFRHSSGICGIRVIDLL